MAESDLDRNQPATQFKLLKARERGQVAKSTDVVSAIVFTSAMVFLAWQGWKGWREQFHFDQALLAHAGRVDASPAALWSLLDTLLRVTMMSAAPFFITLLIAAVVGNVLQTGAILSAHPIKPDWDRLNPASGLKRVFSVHTLFLALRAGLKLALLGVVVYFALKALFPQFYRLASLSALGLVHRMLDDFASLGLKLCAMLGLIALLDLIHSRRQFAKKMRMSHRELKDEMKQREGDPRIRRRLRELRRDMLKKSLALRKTKNADVLITNPTHVAVALHYVHGQMSSPRLVAKGKGFMAAAMRQIAARHHIPVVQSPSLARKLYSELPIDHHVPPELYAQVARIIVWVFARRDAQRDVRRAAPRARTALPTPGRSGSWRL
jgi:flagellar biosynthetic protein FlhB